MKNFTLSLMFVLVSLSIRAQSYYISGIVTNQEGESIPGVNVIVKGTTDGVSTNFDGSFKVEITGDIRVLIFRGVGLQTKELQVDRSFRAQTVTVKMEDSAAQLEEIQIVAESESFIIEKKGFSVEAIETGKIKTQSVALNNVLGRVAGVRVRKSGGVGSDFTYSLNGMSGNAVRFFIDAIPMDYFGSSYSINNIPISLIERIDIYKGVVPVELGADALGGAINLVTNKSVSNFAEASYSFGSFNTHQLSLHGQWRASSGFTTRLSSFYTYSDNNYKVWGTGVHYADASTGYKAIEFTEENPAERFNDDFQTTTVKLDVGVTDKKWADQFLITMLVSDQKQGVQTAQTMARVFGRVRYNEEVIMPALTYQKEDLFTEGLDVNIFAGYSMTKGALVDTSVVQYDWQGDSIGYRLSGGEMGRDGKSQFTQKDESEIYRFNATYELPLNLKIGFNFLYTSTKRTGDDPFSPTYRIPYLEPQNIGSRFGGFSLETRQFDERLHANAFIKYYGYEAKINDLEYTNEWEIVEYENQIDKWGGGYAASFKISSQILLKTSLERATRMPSPTEALGDGVSVNNNPFIKPEQSLNINLGTVLGWYKLGNRHNAKIAASVFYRDLTDQLLFTIIDGQGNGIFENVNKVAGTGAEIDFIYDFDHLLKFTLNGSYLDMRNNLEFEEDGSENIVYRDRMRNTPYLMSNVGLEFTKRDLFQQNSKFFAYLQSSYVHEFFLRWPSLGSAENKSTVPSQLVFDAGMGYTFPSRRLTLALDVSNLLNEQVYDNYLLQKPGRAFFLKINYQIKQK